MYQMSKSKHRLETRRETSWHPRVKSRRTRMHSSSICSIIVRTSLSGTLSALLKTGPVSQRELAEVMNVRAATLSEQIARLDRAGLVERTPSEKDRRSVIVSLSEEGKKEARRCSRERTFSPTTTRPSSSACSRSSPTTGARAISTAANRSQAARAVRFAPSSAGGAARIARSA